MSEFYKLYRKSADEADKLFHQVKERDIVIEGLEAEVERLKGVLGAIAVKAGTSECGGNYVAAVSLIGDLEQMADKALEAKP